MLGDYFYHARIRKAVASFGAMFDDIYVLRTNSSGETISQIKVPLSYAPKRNFIERIQQTVNGEDAERMVAIKLPRMSFEMTGITYDAARQMNKMNNYQRAVSGDNTKRNKLNQFVPYNLDFELSVYAKSQDDALQIVEQIIPTFSPKYMITIKPFEDFTNIKEDVPVVLNSVTMSDDYEGPLEQRRTIIYTLAFTMNVNFYGKVTDSEIIREVNVDLGLIQDEDLDGTDEYTDIERITVVPDPLSATPDSDYGFTTTITEL